MIAQTPKGKHHEGAADGLGTGLGGTTLRRAAMLVYCDEAAVAALSLLSLAPSEASPLTAEAAQGLICVFCWGALCVVNAAKISSTTGTVNKGLLRRKRKVENMGH